MDLNWFGLGCLIFFLGVCWWVTSGSPSRRSSKKRATTRIRTPRRKSWRGLPVIDMALIPPPLREEGKKSEAGKTVTRWLGRLRRSRKGPGGSF